MSTSTTTAANLILAAQRSLSMVNLMEHKTPNVGYSMVVTVNGAAVH
jgi:hypothetical protein